MLKITSIVLVGVIAILGVYLQQTIKIVGLFRSTYEKGSCKPVIPNWCEKIVHFDNKIYAICSTFEKRSQYYPTLHVSNKADVQQDELFVYDGTKTAKIPIRFDHGLLVNGFDIKTVKSKTILVATNVFNMTLEEFEFTKDSLVHLKTIKSELFHALDDVAIADKDQYVITNDHSAHAQNNFFYRVIEDSFSFPNGNVMLYDKNKVTTIISHVPNANGVLIKYNQGLQLWVSSPSEGTLFRYNFNPKENDYTFIDKIKLDFPPDNLSQHNGVVYVAGMVKAHNLIMGIFKLRNGDEQGYFNQDLTSQVVEIKNQTNFFGDLFSKTPKIQSKELHFSTGAIVYKGGYIVSGFNKLMFCKE